MRGCNILEKVAFKPLGSVVIVKGCPKKYMIIARALFSKKNDNGMAKYFDYGAVMYPEGLIGSHIVYFQDKDIEKVIFEGFEDSENKDILDKTCLILERKNVVRCDVQDILEMNREYVARIQKRIGNINEK